jgi:hypothetical protein
MVDRSTARRTTTASRTGATDLPTVTGAVRYAMQFLAWALLHAMSSAGRAMCCLPQGESPIDRPRWWRTEARCGLAELELFLRQQPRRR